jgi:hypothetical protein
MGRWATVGGHEGDLIGTFDEQTKQWTVRDPSWTRGRPSAEHTAKFGGEEGWAQLRVGQVGTYRRMSVVDGTERVVAVDGRGGLITAPSTTESVAALEAAKFRKSEDPRFTGGEFTNREEVFFPRYYGGYPPKDGSRYTPPPSSDVDGEVRGRAWNESVASWEKAAKRAAEQR